MAEQVISNAVRESESAPGQGVAIAVDEDGRITVWSEAAEELYGRAAYEALGRPLAELFTSPDNERRLQAIFDNSLDAILLADDEGRYRDANPAACELLGYTREELVTLSVWDITPQVSRAAGRRMWQTFVQEGSMSGEYTVVCKDGTRRDLEFRAVTNVQPHLHLSVLRDVTERKEAEKQLRHHANRTEALASISQALAAAPLDTRVVMDTITRELAGWIGDSAVLRLFEESGEPIVPVAFYHPDPAKHALLKNILEDEPQRLGKGLETKVLREGRTILLPRVEPHQIRQLLHPRYWQVTEESGMHSLAMAPVRVQGTVAGYLCLARDGQGEPYTEEDLVFLLEIADRAGLSIANARLYEELEQRVQQRTVQLSRANAQLQQEIAERELAEAAEREQRALAQALSSSAAVLNQTLNLEDVLDRILENLENVVPHDVAHVMLREEDEVRVARLVCRHEQPADMRTLRRRLEEMPLMRQMLDSGHGLLISDLTGKHSPHNLPFMEEMHSYSGAPIRHGAETIGFLHVGSVTPGFYTTDHLKWLDAFAQHAAVALLNARLYERAQELAAVEERQRLARELHDAVVQTLWSMTIIADVLPDVWRQDPQKGLERLKRLRRLTRGALAEMRALLVELRPTILEEHDLEELLEQLLEAAGSRTRAAIRFTAQGSCRPPLAVQYACYRIAQEALNNVIRHAHPSRIELQLACDEGYIEMCVTDDGVGFSPDEVGPGHMGLSIMQERAAEVDASFELKASAGQGTTVQVRWPASTEE
jgi:PAS domain S-box-containing protein